MYMYVYIYIYMYIYIYILGGRPAGVLAACALAAAVGGEPPV